MKDLEANFTLALGITVFSILLYGAQQLSGTGL